VGLLEFLEYLLNFLVVLDEQGDGIGRSLASPGLVAFRHVMSPSVRQFNVGQAWRGKRRKAKSAPDPMPWHGTCCHVL
jgi:hypothetical protein